jgi:hypothetical protein
MYRELFLDRERCPPGRLPLFVIKIPKHCVEYVADGLGDIDCPGIPVQDSEKFGHCPICLANYEIDADANMSFYPGWAL